MYIHDSIVYGFAVAACSAWVYAAWRERRVFGLAIFAISLIVLALVVLCTPK